MYVIIALVTGGLIIISMIINANLSKRVGVIQGTAVNYIIGLIFSIILFTISRDWVLLSRINIIELPKLYLLGGLLGVLVIMNNNVIVPKIPAAYTTILIFTGQLVAGILIDYVKLGVFTKGKVIGGILVISGLLIDVIMNKRKCNKTQISV